MIYRTFKDKKLSLLGFGTMRLPVNEDKSINEKEFQDMFDLAIENGVNYFDTAWPYHAGLSEVSLGKVMKKHDRSKFYIADKFPGHQIASSYNPKEIFEKQLEKLGTDYIDFYLLHNVYEKSIDVYEDPKWGIIDYFIEQKKLGRIKHLGFSTHGSLETMKKFLDKYHDVLEFCQIQFNFLDWTLQNAKEKYELISSYNIPVWVMEPVRGGKLANLSEKHHNMLQAYNEGSDASFALRFVQGMDNVRMILSGMSNLEQMKDNLKTFNEYKPLSDKQKETLFEIAEDIKQSIPCTGCGYCLDGCPKHLNIPRFISTLNDINVFKHVNSIMWIEALEDELKPNACIKCGACMKVCPQNLEIPKLLEELHTKIGTMPSWKEISKQREEESKRIK